LGDTITIQAPGFNAGFRGKLWSLTWIVDLGIVGHGLVQFLDLSLKCAGQRMNGVFAASAFL
jgi:hypothetical protein